MDIIQKVVSSKKRNGGSTVLSEIIDDKSLTWDHPKVIQLATEVISDYGVVIKKTSKMMFGVPESMLPYPKKDIREAIELLLCFMKNKSLWEELREECPDTADLILTNKYFNALRTAYIKLAKFIPDSEAKLAIKAASLFNTSGIEEFDDIRGELSSSWFKKARELQRRVNEESSLLMVEIEAKYGKKLFTH